MKIKIVLGLSTPFIFSLLAACNTAPIAQPSQTLGGGSGGSMLALASAFQQQGMPPSMIQQFIPVVLEYV